MMHWYEIHQSDIVRERLREAGRARLAAAARRAVVPRGPESRGARAGAGRRTVFAGTFGAVLGWFLRP